MERRGREGPAHKGGTVEKWSSTTAADDVLHNIPLEYTFHYQQLQQMKDLVIKL